MSNKSKKSFSAISDFLTPTQEVEIVETKQPEKESPASKNKLKPKKIAEPKTAQMHEAIKVDDQNFDPLDEGFVRWTTYINPKYKKLFKLRAVESDTEIYKILDALLKKELEKK